MQHNTFSLQNILNEPLDPVICKKILQEIKSPLMQQSFAMTNDQSLSNSWINAPKRPNIPPPSYQNTHNTRRPIIKSNYSSSHGNGFGQSCQPTESFYEFQNFNHNQSYIKANKQKNKHSSSPYTENKEFLQSITKNADIFQFNNKQSYGYDQNNNMANRLNANRAESIVSPLDPSITMKKEQNLWDTSGIENIWRLFCGGQIGSTQNLQQELCYVQNEKGRQIKRKKIFQHKKSQNDTVKNNNKQIKSCLLSNGLNNSHIVKIDTENNQLEQLKENTLKQVLRQLNLNQHKDVAQFLQLICPAMDLFSKAAKERAFLLENIEILYQLSNTQENNLSGMIIGEQKYSKFLQRMSFSSVTDMIRKLGRNKLMSQRKMNIKEHQILKNKVSESLQNMLLHYSQVQNMLHQFISSQRNSQNRQVKENNSHNQGVNCLQFVYKLIMRQFNNSESMSSTLEVLVEMFKDVRLYNKYEGMLHELQYIWQGIGERVLSEQEFINGVVRMQGKYVKNSALSHRHQDGSRVLNDSHYRFQSQLVGMGYVKNQ